MWLAVCLSEYVRILICVTSPCTEDLVSKIYDPVWILSVKSDD